MLNPNPDALAESEDVNSCAQRIFAFYKEYQHEGP